MADTIARLAALRAENQHGGSSQGSGRLTALQEFGSNPGGLRAHVYIPESLADEAALVVVLHGCTQSAAAYDAGSGWSEMADRHGFAVLFAEQRRQNNFNLCFDWFAPDDVRRGSGEVCSIRQMIAALVSGHPIDPARIFITGLSAGGAMTTAMLATYPEVFAGGAIIAGLPFGCAGSISEAFDRMRGHGLADAGALSAKVREASDHAGPWPTLSIWHGSADTTVSPANVDAIVRQWRSLHRVTEVPTRVEAVDGHSRRSWCNDRGAEVIEAYNIVGMGHGTPLDTRSEDGCGHSGPFMLEAGISSTGHICRFWGLTEPAQKAPSAEEGASPAAMSPVSVMGKAGKAIEDALRGAGLMR